MFNFFDEIKNKLCIKEDAVGAYNIINISGRALYAEGHKGIVILSSEKIVFKLKFGCMHVVGRDLILAELNQNSLYISGEILKTEVAQ